MNLEFLPSLSSDFPNTFLLLKVDWLILNKGIDHLEGKEKQLSTVSVQNKRNVFGHWLFLFISTLRKMPVKWDNAHKTLSKTSGP